MIYAQSKLISFLHGSRIFFFKNIDFSTLHDQRDRTHDVHNLSYLRQANKEVHSIYLILIDLAEERGQKRREKEKGTENGVENPLLSMSFVQYKSLCVVQLGSFARTENHWIHWWASYILIYIHICINIKYIIVCVSIKYAVEDLAWRHNRTTKSLRFTHNIFAKFYAKPA